ncbi:hypothetical protein BDP55DRAFT_629837 [Colletotrichum godetiae]|uniref:Uncharacterized protein n=1 Tax=Colletotrichum godetiae TaxID=1209918 RepID=A0AAJ0ASN7_9PEZI|nr:uncharacterized protein BDP55DRAFT_629837 [Colletotrichum godetiae]KAK1688231.1 hypothetical protein BDP55DRAFT_629837 [Colletotrichum godetiae]
MRRLPICGFAGSSLLVQPCFPVHPSVATTIELCACDRTSREPPLPLRRDPTPETNCMACPSTDGFLGVASDPRNARHGAPCKLDVAPPCGFSVSCTDLPSTYEYALLLLPSSSLAA